MSKKGLSNNELLLLVIVVIVVVLIMSSPDFLPALSGFMQHVYHP